MTATRQSRLVERDWRNSFRFLTENVGSLQGESGGENCGIGPGGFQPGNTCAKGGGGSGGLHPGVGRLRELLGAKGVSHEHLSDQDLHSILSEASSTPEPAPKPREKVTKEPSTTSPVVADRASKVLELRERMNAIASDPSRRENLDSHADRAEGEVKSLTDGLSHADLKALGDAVGVIGARGMAKGKLLGEIAGRVTRSLRSLGGLRQ